MKKEGGGISSLSPAIRKGLQKALENDRPFLLSPINWAASKIVGEKKVKDAYWKYVIKPVVNMDIRAGQQAQKVLDKVTGKKGSLFKENKILPTGRASREGTGQKEYKIPSVLAPVAKAGKFVLPLAGAMKLDETYQKSKRKGDMSEKQITKADLQKTAEMLSYLQDQNVTFEKRAKATELLYKQAELGQIKFPKTFAELQEKVAELLSKDLKVVEEAIKMASTSEDMNSWGGLETNAGMVSGAHEVFANTIIND